MASLRVAMVVFLAASVQAQSLDVPPTAAQLRESVDRGCVSSGKHIGVDYAGALERAIRGESAGLAELFRYTVIGEMDGAAGEAHAGVLFGLLQRWGDRQFAHVLRVQKLGIRKAVIGNLPMSPEILRKFPSTFGIVRVER